MTRCPGRAWRRGLAAAAALVAVSAMAAATDYEDAFRQGMAALDQKKWSVAASSFRTAIAANPREGGRRIRVYGTWLVDYLPNYYLGLALVQLGDPEGAAAAWRECRRQGAVLETPLASELERRERSLPAPPAGSGPAPAPATAAPPAPISAVGPSPAESSAPPGAMRSGPAGPGAAAPEPAEAAAVAAPPVAAEPAASAIPADAAARERILLAAARFFFGGDYRSCVATLTRAPEEVRSDARACLLRSAALFALAREAGSADPRALEAPRRELLGCRAELAGTVPDRRMFSPLFARFVESTLATR